jgi:hypothetical protein
LDRLFGCVNQRLQRSGNAELSIHYPFLQGSVDEDQVASFIERKHQVEEQMDACVQVHFDKQLRISDAQQWRSFRADRYPSAMSVCRILMVPCLPSWANSSCKHMRI